MRKIISLWILFLLANGLCGFAQEEPTPAENPSPAETPKPVIAKPDAVKLYRSQNYQEAVSTCLNEIKQTPGNRDSYVVLGWSLIALGRYEEALDYTRQGIERAGADGRLMANIQESLSKHYAALYSAGNYNEALAKIQRLVSSLPNSEKIHSAYALMGDIYLKKGYFIYADIAFSLALHGNPNIFEWWVGAGTAREKAGDYRSALAAYTEALKLNPDNQEALRGRDRARQKLSE